MLRKVSSGADVSRTVCVESVIPVRKLSFTAFTIIAVVSLVFSLIGVVVNAPAALAQNTCVGTWNNLRWVDGGEDGGVVGDSYKNINKAAEAKFDWQVPDTAKKGDSFTFNLPPQLMLAPGAQSRFPLMKGNEKVADAEWNGKTLTITLTDFADRHRSVHGDVEVALKWDENVVGREGYDASAGGLRFTGCDGRSTGNLKGVYPKPGRGGNTHPNSKRGLIPERKEDYEVMIDGKTYYSIQWIVAITAESHQNYFQVKDTAPTGHKFVCNKLQDTHTGKNIPGVNIYTWHSDPPQFLDGEILDSHRQPRGANDGYHIDCSEKELTVTFQYGVYAESAPSLQFYTYTDKKPEPGTQIVNTAHVDGDEVVGSVKIPRNSGHGTGKKGGFTIKKIVAGNAPSNLKEFTFKYSCVGPTGNKKSDTISVAAGGDYQHVVNGIEKNMVCEVEELTPEDGGIKPKLSWTLNGDPFEGDAVKFTANDTGEDAIDLEATNTYETRPITAPFRIAKKVVGDDPLLKKLQGKQYEFTYTCDGESEKTALVDVDNPFESKEQYPVGTACTISEVKDKARVDGYTLVSSLMPTDGKITITQVSEGSEAATVEAINAYTPEPKGVFKVTKDIKGEGAVVTDKKYESKQFSGRYKCDEKDDWTLFTFSKSQPYISPNFNKGTQCVVEETEGGANIDGYKWTRPEEQRVTILENDQAEISVPFVNTYDQKVGGFSITKSIEGSAKDADVIKDLEYSFDYVCGEEKGTLPVKAGQTVLGPKDLQVGTECTVTETEVHAPAGIKWTGSSIPVSKFTILENETVEVKATNNFDYMKGGFAILKTVAGTATDLAELHDKHYEFGYVCKQPDGTELKKFVLVTPGETIQVSDIQVGSVCEITETKQNHMHADWNVEFSGENVELEHGKATIKVSEKTAPTVVINAKNIFTQHVGGFSIAKEVKAPVGVAVPTEFKFAWTCGSRDGEITVPVKDGKGILEVAKDIPVGTECTVSEIGGDVAGTVLTTHWQNQKFTISEQGTHIVATATNSYAQKVGSFLLDKKLIGSQKDKAVDKEFEFTYVCTKPESEDIVGNLHVKGEGRTDQVNNIPVGYACSVAEKDAGIDGANWRHTISNDGQITIEAENVVYQVHVVNAYEKPELPPVVPIIPITPMLPMLPPASSSVGPQPQNSNGIPNKDKTQKPQNNKNILAKTGANVFGLSFIALMLFGLGLFLTCRFHRRRNNI
ncbi:DUF5979 domain-containing protein [Corynebacterium diphtheriae]|uniref:DUF5979 domain-containing protein n=1 Tax=Corynebacterium diphtheriae TaxID=1717 RepID=UPI00178167DA|nr:DUF5979 domain-containing protein [Corynebacterium diphtheriae]QOE68592.1 hypothetical protein FGA20_09465 [Corynebacterium diphtheriae bv. mitis]